MLLYSNGNCYIGEVQCGCPWGLGLLISDENKEGLRVCLGTFRKGSLVGEDPRVVMVSNPRPSEVPLVVVGRGDDDDGWYDYDYRALLRSVVEAEGRQWGDTEEEQEEESWEDIIPRELLILSGPPSDSMRTILMSSTTARLSSQSFVGMLHTPHGEEEEGDVCVRLVPLPSAPPHGRIHLGGDITIKRSTAWVNSFTRLCRISSRDDAAIDVVKIYGAYKAPDGNFYLATQCFVDANGRPLNDIKRASTVMASERKKKAEMTDEEYKNSARLGNTTNSDSDYVLIFTYRLCKALECLHRHGGVSYNGQLSFGDILFREGKEGLR